MGFSVSFRMSTSVDTAHSTAVSDSVPPEDLTDYDYEHLVMVACEALSEAGCGTFQMGGFGNDEWPVDVAYDLSVFMEQVPSLVARLRERQDFEMDLYSQGLERTLVFRHVEDTVVIQCLSRTAWTPRPEFETLARAELLAMVSELATNVMAGVKKVAPPLSKRLLLAWRETG
jgi:hypothetical protein